MDASAAQLAAQRMIDAVEFNYSGDTYASAYVELVRALGGWGATNLPPPAPSSGYLLALSIRASMSSITGTAIP